MKLKCNAKINLCLNITGKRDDGYHLIDSVMQSISLCDIVDIEKSDKITVTCSKSEFGGKKNIAYKAAEAFFKYTGINGGADIKIQKGIPDAGGLGGGSSDAAGVIIALNKIYNTQLSEQSLLDIGVSVGADVPFCILGGTKRVKGIGEILEAIKSLENVCFIIAKNGTKPSTKEMYSLVDKSDNIEHPDTESFARLLSVGDIKGASKHIGNSFQSVTGLYYIDEMLKDTNALKICLSGSGPSVFAMYQTEDSADNALKILKDKGIEAYKTTTQENGIEVI